MVPRSDISDSSDKSDKFAHGGRAMPGDFAERVLYMEFTCILQALFSNP